MVKEGHKPELIIIAGPNGHKPYYPILKIKQITIEAYPGKTAEIRFFYSQILPLSKKTITFAYVSLKSIPCEGYRDNFVRK